MDFDFDDIMKDIDYAENVLEKTIKFKSLNSKNNSTNNSIEIKTNKDSSNQYRYEDLNVNNNNRSNVSTPDSIDQSNQLNSISKYSTPEEREKLIIRLLAERDNRLNKSKASVNTNETLPSNTHYDDDTLFFASELNDNNRNTNNNVVDAFEELSYSQINPVRPLTKTRKLSINRSLSRSVSPNKRYLKSKDDLINEANNKFKEQYSFKPNLIAKVSRSQSLSPTRLSNRKDRIDKMLNHYLTSIKNREKLKREEEKFELLDCTFTPKITKKAKELINKSKDDIINQSNEYKDISLRLHEDAITRIQQQRWLYKHIEQSKQQQYTFQPTINPSNINKSEDYKPIYERIPQLQKEKLVKLNHIKSDIEQNLQHTMTFHPLINNKSRHLAKRRISRSLSPTMSVGTDIGSRLINEGKRINQNKIKLQQEYDDNNYNNSPSYKSNNKISLDHNELYQGDFINRQNKYLQYIKKKINNKKQTIEASSNQWFQPNVNNNITNKIIKSQYPERLNESIDDKVYRLSIIDSNNQLNNKNNLYQHIYKDMTFQPNINKVSQIIGKSSSLDELVNNSKGKIKFNQLKQQIDNQLDKEYSFHPKITNYYIKNNTVDNQESKSHYGWLDCPIDTQEVTIPKNKLMINMKEPEKMIQNINYYINNKNEQRNNQLVMKEINELKECTFQPNIQSSSLLLHKLNSKMNEPVVVKGLGRHLELQSQSFRLKQLAKQREDEVFNVRNVNRYRDPMNNSTIIEPFTLSESSPTRQSKVVLELLNEEKSHLRFYPEIIEYKRRLSQN